MATLIQHLHLAELATYVPGVTETELGSMREAFQQNRNRIYSFSFWSTDNEIEAEDLMERTFRRVFARTTTPSAEQIDQAFIRELRETQPVGNLTLAVKPVSEVRSIRTNLMRVHLERAVMQVPVTERLAYLLHDGEGYSHEQVGGLLGLTATESREAAHAGRMHIRESAAAMR